MARKVSKAEQDAARESLRELLPAGSTASTIVLHVSQSGMSRAIAVLVADGGEVRNVSGLVARAVGWSLHRTHDGVVVQGCGMDMAFHLVYVLGQTLHGDGYALTQRRI